MRAGADPVVRRDVAIDRSFSMGHALSSCAADGRYCHGERCAARCAPTFDGRADVIYRREAPQTRRALIVAGFGATQQTSHQLRGRSAEGDPGQIV